MADEVTNTKNEAAQVAPDGGPAPEPRPQGQSGPQYNQRGGGGRDGPGAGRSRDRYIPRRRVCAFCVDKVENIDYNDMARLRKYLSERAKIETRRKSSTCARVQRALSVA